GVFAWMLFSHKVCRWLLPWAGLLGFAGLALLAPANPLAAWGFAGAVGFLALAGAAWVLSDRVRLPGVLQLAAFALMGNLTALHATVRALAGSQQARWEPTRREAH